MLSNPGLEYWQGLDSLTAPFVAITWHCSNGEALAFALLQRMVRKFLSGMFLQKNTSQLQTQLIVFNQLLAFHDPKLFLHLHNHQFLPELFAIPWFLTLFTHILPIDSTLRLWDFLFLHDSTMIHFISIAVMRQLRSRLLPIDFNDMVLFFSELHSKQGLDMTRVIAEAVKISGLCSFGKGGGFSVSQSQRRHPKLLGHGSLFRRRKTIVGSFAGTPFPQAVCGRFGHLDQGKACSDCRF